MCREVFLSNFEIYQALWAFLVLGVVKEVDRAGESTPGVAIGGRLERASLPDLAQVAGINAETARKIYEFFHEQAAS